MEEEEAVEVKVEVEVVMVMAWRCTKGCTQRAYGTLSLKAIVGPILVGIV